MSFAEIMALPPLQEPSEDALLRSPGHEQDMETENQESHMAQVSRLGEKEEKT